MQSLMTHADSAHVCRYLDLLAQSIEEKETRIAELESLFQDAIVQKDALAQKFQDLQAHYTLLRNDVEEKTAIVQKLGAECRALRTLATEKDLRINTLESNFRDVARQRDQYYHELQAVLRTQYNRPQETSVPPRNTPTNASPQEKSFLQRFMDSLTTSSSAQDKKQQEAAIRAEAIAYRKRTRG